MEVTLREIHGPWDAGWVLDKHMIKSTFLGHDAFGNPQFENLRTEAGEATYQLKYRSDWSQAKPLAQAVADNICPKLQSIGFIVPMPASRSRSRQPVTEVAKELGGLLNAPMFDGILLKAPNGKSLKDLATKAEKVEAIGKSLSVKDQITNDGSWNVLLIDDLYDSGASMEAACKVLRGYPKVRKIYVAALTWK
ncbi:ComF family protein [Piscinibacter gummiphilus]|uniref:ComF family protein n=1 Tax=Piscinibacter gummiphilus TaxID=946333 RepID=A0ABZ0CM34_9BURK|nr:ComF family protein [Piscinibacter gummiphilus]WOB05888.1 ComF family protein [Piscinibacter gummiphilus]